VAVAREALDRLEEGLLALPKMEDSAATLRQHLLDAGPSVLGGSTAPEAYAELALLLRRAGEHVGARVSEVAPVPDSAQVGMLYRVSCRIELEADSPMLARLLAGFASNEPAVVVREISIRAPGSASDDEAERLQVSLVTSGWRLRPEPVQTNGME
jgi:hypothetical protein